MCTHFDVPAMVLLVTPAYVSMHSLHICEDTFTHRMLGDCTYTCDTGAQSHQHACLLRAHKSVWPDVGTLMQALRAGGHTSSSLSSSD